MTICFAPISFCTLYDRLIRVRTWLWRRTARSLRYSLLHCDGFHVGLLYRWEALSCRVVFDLKPGLG
jgi:hypothetical protein